MSTLTEEILRVNCEVYLILQPYFSATVSNDYSCLPGHFTFCQALQRQSAWKAETVHY